MTSPSSNMIASAECTKLHPADDNGQPVTSPPLKPMPGDAVRLDGQITGADNGSIGIIEGGIGKFRERPMLTFNPSAYRDEGRVMVSGGPGIYIDINELDWTGATYTFKFWKFKNGIRKGHNDETFELDVPLWSWKGPRGEYCFRPRSDVIKEMATRTCFPDNIQCPICWDCACEDENFIHFKVSLKDRTKNKCDKCGCDEDDGRPDSLAYEMLALYPRIPMGLILKNPLHPIAKQIEDYSLADIHELRKIINAGPGDPAALTRLAEECFAK